VQRTPAMSRRPVDRNFGLPGFTLLEVILAMIIGLTVILMAYRVIQNIRDEWTGFYRAQNDLILLTVFNGALTQDINNARFIKAVDSSSFELIDGTDTITYAFGINILRARNNHTDTFPITVDRVSCALINALSEDRIVYSLAIKISQPMPIENVIFRKCYSSEELMALYTQTEQDY
jgi:prepilin-type N-terminal cleavage/methylation domain-containing protein